MRATVAVAVTCLALTGLTMASETEASVKKFTDIPAQALGSALVSLEKHRNLEVIFVAEDVRDVRTPGATGQLTSEETLKQLLNGTGLTYRCMDEKTITILPTKPVPTPQGSSPLSASPGAGDERRAGDEGPSLSTFKESEGRAKRESEASKKSFWQRRKLAQSGATSQNKNRPSHENEPPIEKLAEITVTAQKRVENLQDVPISVQVISGQSLGQRNLNSLEALSHAVPSVHITTTVGRSGEMFIRGVGSGNSQSFDQSVGMFIDDIYHGRVRTSAATFLDLDRVEILKGPQSTFFGNNAIAGAFNIVTRKPGGQFESSARALYGDDRQYAAEGAAGGPITDTVSIRAAAAFTGIGGWVSNVNTGRDQPDEDNMAGRITLAFRPNEALDATLKIEGTRKRNHSGLFGQIAECPPPQPYTLSTPCAVALSLGLPIGLDKRQNAEEGGQLLNLDTFDNVLTVNYEQRGHTLTSVSGFYNYDYRLNFDGFGTPLLLVNVQVPERFHQFSQELRITSPADQTIEYSAGAYFQTNRLASHVDFNFSVLNTPIQAIPAFAALVPYLPIGQDTHFIIDERTYSLFGSASYNPTDRLKVTAGLRVSKVHKDFDYSLAYGTATEPYGGFVPLPAALALLPAAFGTGVPSTQDLTRTDDAWMPSLKVQYKLDPFAMIYLSYARGFKSGGFNAGDNSGVAANYPFAPEHVDAYEAGLKSEWLDSRLLVNLTAFRSDYKDLQVTVSGLNVVGATASLVRNAAKSRSQGVEFEGQWIADKHLRFSVAGTYLDSSFVSYPNGGPTTLQQLQGIRFQDLSGKPTPYAPKWSGSVTGSYSADLPGEYGMTFELSGYLSSRYSMSAVDDPLVQHEGYARLDGRLTFETSDERWALDVIGKNLTDRNILVWNGYPRQQTQQPRNFAVQFRYRW